MSRRKIAGQTRRNAQLAGERKYVNPWPCPRGHTVRYTSNGKCVHCHIAHVERRNEIRKGVDTRAAYVIQCVP